LLQQIPVATPHRCPQCYSEEIDRIRRRGAIRRVVLSLLRRHAYQCRDCGAQFYDRPSPKQKRRAA